MKTPPTAAATAPSCAVKPVALLFPKVIPAAVDCPPAAVVVLSPLTAPVAVAGLAVAVPPPPPPTASVAVAGLAVAAPPPLPPAVTGYPAFAQSFSMANECSSSEKDPLLKKNATNLGGKQVRQHPPLHRTEYID